MRTVTYRLVDLQRETIPIGFRGENEYTRVIFDCLKALDKAKEKQAETDEPAEE